MTRFHESRPARQNPADQIRTLIRRGRELIAPLDRETFNRRPPAGGWSPGECVEHVNTSLRLFLPVLAEAIDDARARGLLNGTGDGRTMLGRLIAWSQEPPYRIRMKTYDDLQPRAEEDGFDPAAVLEEFEALHEELIVRINESRDLDRKRVKVRSVVDRRLRLSLDDWFAFLAAHARRHLWQADQALAAATTPAGLD